MLDCILYGGVNQRRFYAKRSLYHQCTQSLCSKRFNKERTRLRRNIFLQIVRRSFYSFWMRASRADTGGLLGD